jgi:hypothetical protein
LPSWRSTKEAATRSSTSTVRGGASPNAFANLLAKVWYPMMKHEPQARANHGQSLDALAQRGGLSPYELLAVLFDHPFWRCSLPEPATVIKKLKEKTTGF